MADSTKKDIAISIQDIHKSFTVSTGVGGVKQLFVERGKRTSKTHSFVALDGVSVEIEKGEFFGIVGRNGSGKSTLLKILAGVYTPTSGKVVVNGILTPFIELGVGFNPELTGKDNVYLNGALLGFNRKQMDAMYDDIVQFAELEEFMNERLKNYSSGMQVRLAFSVAIKAQSDVLLIDEVLAVGDTAFQNKCLNYFRKIKRDGRTVVFVTHDMGAVERFCDRVLVLDKAKVDGIYSAKKAVQRYQYHNALSELRAEEKQNQTNKTETKSEKEKIAKIQKLAPKTIQSVTIADAPNPEKVLVTAGKPLSIDIDLKKLPKKVEAAVSDLRISLSIHDQTGAQIAGADNAEFEVDGNAQTVRASFPHSPFLPGVYSIYTGMYGKDKNGTYKTIDAVQKPVVFAAITEHGGAGSGQFFFWPDWSTKKK